MSRPLTFVQTGDLHLGNPFAFAGIRLPGSCARSWMLLLRSFSCASRSSRLPSDCRRLV
jgi:hypothetical protein